MPVAAQVGPSQVANPGQVEIALHVGLVPQVVCAPHVVNGAQVSAWQVEYPWQVGYPWHVFCDAEHVDTQLAAPPQVGPTQDGYCSKHVGWGMQVPP
ncbi:MAG: hypothetical protein AB1752_09870 [Candidatus Zixiibacteriota bacterium]